MANTTQTLEALHSGSYKRTTRLKLSSPTLLTFPPAILSLYTTLTTLDLSSTGLSSLPASISRLHNLKILFCSSCNFTTFPAQLAHCRSLEMLAFKSNHMTRIPEGSFPRKLRWLILTDNEIGELPGSIGECAGLEKCMLAGNRLRGLPVEMARCRKLGLLRVARNEIEVFPEWVLGMPELAFFSFAGNPCSAGPVPVAVTVSGDITPQSLRTSNSPGAVVNGRTPPTELEDIPWTSLTTHEILGSGASGVIYKGTWNRQNQDVGDDHHQQDLQVAIKLFKGAITSDGSPLDELAACITAGAHSNLISPLGRITYESPSDPSDSTTTTTTTNSDSKQGLVLQLIPPTYTVLGQPPTMQTCTRDVFAETLVLSVEACKRVLVGIARAAERLHERGVVHGDLYAHNILVDGRGDALLGDFGAATVLPDGGDDVGESKGQNGAARRTRYDSSIRKRLEKMEVLAMGHLVEDLLGVLERKVVDLDYADGEDVLSEKDAYVIEGLNALHWRCTDPVVDQRPDFREVREILEGF